MTKTKQRLLILLVVIILVVTGSANATTDEYHFTCPDGALCFIEVGHHSKVRFDCSSYTDRFVIGATRYNQGDLECYGFPR